jgi:hypothetical protein
MKSIKLIKLEKNEMGGACGEVCTKVLEGKPEGKRPLGRQRRRWEDKRRVRKVKIQRS